MTGFDYSKIRATAQTLIARFGMAGAIRRRANSGPSYNPVVSETDHPCRLVLLDYEDAHIDGTLVRRADRLVYLSTEGLTITPTEADRIITGGETYSIVALRPLAPAGIGLFYEIQARR